MRKAIGTAVLTVVMAVSLSADCGGSTAGNDGCDPSYQSCQSNISAQNTIATVSIGGALAFIGGIALWLIEEGVFGL